MRSRQSVARCAWALALSWLSVAVVGCIEPAKPQTGGETHFLSACGGICAEGLSCVCGVCTRPCDDKGGCDELMPGAVCMGDGDTADTRECATVSQREEKDVCDMPCGDDGDCIVMGADYECREGLCREAEVSAGNTDEEEVTPFVMLLLDTSGSMERTGKCVCEDIGCVNCLPDCDTKTSNRWTNVVGALTGTFVDMQCTVLARTPESGATYDLGYYLPHLKLHADSTQRADGIVAAYASRMRFGVATFDGIETYRDANPLIKEMEFDYVISAGGHGMFSYPTGLSAEAHVRPDGSTVGRVRYPACPDYFAIDTGIRSRNAFDGNLAVASRQDRMPQFADDLRKYLFAVRPFGGTPIAASLDDLYHFFSIDPEGVATASSRAPRVVVLITDGYPDSDYRDEGCDCVENDNCGLFTIDDDDETKLYECPYPSSEDAARNLRCGFGSEASVCAGPADAVYVIGTSIETDKVKERLDAIAASGGTDHARFAEETEADLQAALREVLDDVLTRKPR